MVKLNQHSIRLQRNKRKSSIHALTRLAYTIFFLGMILSILLPKHVDAHSLLLEANPSPNSELKESPHAVTLTFNERLEGSLYQLKVLDDKGKLVTTEKPILSKDHKKLQLDIPKVKNGIFTVTYRVISLDGHPIEASYVFTVGALNQTQEESIVKPNGHSGHQGLGNVWIVRALYYLSLLSITGWVIWRGLLPLSTDKEKNVYNFWMKNLKFAYLLMLSSVGLVQMSGLFSGAHFADIVSLFTKTNVGITWGISILLAIAGIFLLGRWKWFDWMWAISLLILEGINGHAITFEPSVISILLDVVHLIAAAVWIGGLIYIIGFWRRYPEHIKTFLPLFSKAAFVSIVVLIFSGTLSTVLFLPKLSYLTKSLWGILLLGKVGLIILILAIGWMIRRRIKRHHHQKLRFWLISDFSVMIAIVIIIGGLTYTSPLPENKPLEWKQTKGSFSMTMTIDPKQPNTINHFQIQLHSKDGIKPNEVVVLLTYKGDKKLAPIEVEMKQKNHHSASTDYTFKSSGPYFSLVGKWEVGVEILDEKDDYTVFERTTTLYQDQK